MTQTPEQTIEQLVDELNVTESPSEAMDIHNTLCEWQEYFSKLQKECIELSVDKPATVMDAFYTISDYFESMSIVAGEQATYALEVYEELIEHEKDVRLYGDYAAQVRSTYRNGAL